jgi:hypothetical protein
MAEGQDVYEREWPAYGFYFALTNTMLGAAESSEYAKWCIERRQRKSAMTIFDWLLELEEVLMSTAFPPEEKRTNAVTAGSRPVQQTLAAYEAEEIAEDEYTLADDEYGFSFSDVDRAGALLTALQVAPESEQSDAEEEEDDKVVALYGEKAKASKPKQADPPKCEICSTSNKTVKHLLIKCLTFIGKSEDQRMKWLMEHKKCLNCFGEKHMAAKCESKRRCTVCKARHHQMVHGVATTIKANSTWKVKPKSGQQRRPYLNKS